MTPLIDVIFLLLLFFMLTSTFSKFAEVEVSAASAAASTSDTPPKITFLKLAADTLSLDGQPHDLTTATTALTARTTEDEPVIVLVQVGAAVTAQRLTDLLVALRKVQGISVNVMSPT